MLPVILISLSGLFVQGAHSYLLYSQRSDRKWSISHHAALNRHTRVMYIIAHFIGGLAWILASYLLFHSSYPLIFAIFIIMAIFQWLQAFTIGNPDTTSLHFKFAYAMWTCAELITVFGTILLPLTLFERTLSALLALSVVGMSAYMFFRKTSKHYYLIQYVVIWLLFFAALLYAVALAN